MDSVICWSFPDFVSWTIWKAAMYQSLSSWAEHESCSHVGLSIRVFKKADFVEENMKIFDEIYFRTNLDNGKSIMFSGGEYIRCASVMSGGEGEMLAQISTKKVMLTSNVPFQFLKIWILTIGWEAVLMMCLGLHMGLTIKSGWMKQWRYSDWENKGS